MKIIIEMKTLKIFEKRDAEKLIRQGKDCLVTTGKIRASAKALLNAAGKHYRENVKRVSSRRAEMKENN
jgi:hypothetical protein